MKMFVLTPIFFFFLFCSGGLGSPLQEKDPVRREGKTITHVHISRVDDKKWPFRELRCPYPYVHVAGMCIYAVCIPTTGMSWAGAQAFCGGEDLGSLASFQTACQLADITVYLNSIPKGNQCNYWVGGQLDPTSVTSGNWTWLNGEQMPRGSPFWDVSTQNGILPTNISPKIYAQLQFASNFRLVDIADGSTNGNAPLCRYEPPKIDFTNSIKVIPTYYYAQDHSEDNFSNRNYN